METIKDRLNKAFEELRYQKKVTSQTDFGSQMGYNKSHFSELMTGRKPVTNSFAVELQTKFGLRIEWLIDGRGEMFIVPQRPAKKVPLIGEAAAGGNMQVYVDDTPSSQQMEYIDVGDLLRDSEAAFTVYGNSMNPNYPSGCILGIRLNADSFIQPGEIYMLVTKSNRVFKRIYYTKEKTHYLCHSDNTLTHEGGGLKGELYYPPFEVPIKEVLHVYDVVGMIKRTRNSAVILRQT